MNIHGAAFVEGLTGFALVACLAIGLRIEAVDGLGKDTRTSGLTDATRSAEEVGMCELTCANGIFQRSGYGLLPDHRVEGSGTILARGNDIFGHDD